MRKYFLIILYVTGFYFAQGREINTVIKEIPEAYSFSESPVPHTELNLSTQFAASVPLLRVVKNLTGGSESYLADLPVLSFYVTGLNKVSNSLHSKRYLTHIHPTHHFW